MGLKHGRGIVVRDIGFLWKPTHATMRVSGVSPRFVDIIVHTVEGHGRLRAKVESDLWGVGIEHGEVGAEYQYNRGFAQHKAALTPADVRQVIEKALDDGWDPTARGQHELEGPLKLTDYSVRGSFGDTGETSRARSLVDEATDF